MSEAHLQHIFGLYSNGQIKTEKHYSDYSRALIFFESKDDAKYAYNHLAGRGRPRRSDDRREDSKVEDDDCTMMDGQAVYLRIMYYEHSYRRRGHDRPRERNNLYEDRHRGRRDNYRDSRRDKYKSRSRERSYDRDRKFRGSNRRDDRRRERSPKAYKRE